jgi:hypothetical protein
MSSSVATDQLPHSTTHHSTLAADAASPQFAYIKPIPGKRKAEDSAREDDDLKRTRVCNEKSCSIFAGRMSGSFCSPFCAATAHLDPPSDKKAPVQAKEESLMQNPKRGEEETSSTSSRLMSASSLPVEVLKSYPPRDECNVFFQLPHTDGVWQINAHMRDVCQNMPDGEPNEWMQSARDKETKIVCFPQGLWTKEEFVNGIAYLVKGGYVSDEEDLVVLLTRLNFFSYMCHAIHIDNLTYCLESFIHTNPLSREDFLSVFRYAQPRKEKEILGLLGFVALKNTYEPPLEADVWASLGMNHVSAVVSHVSAYMNSKLEEITRKEGYGDNMRVVNKIQKVIKEMSVFKTVRGGAQLPPCPPSLE